VLHGGQVAKGHIGTKVEVEVGGRYPLADGNMITEDANKIGGCHQGPGLFHPHRRPA